jgi:hypothetical protein
MVLDERKRHVYYIYGVGRENQSEVVVRRMVVPLAHQSSNPGFDICVSHKGRIFIQWEAMFP